MRYAVVSDIHANLEALVAVLKAMEPLGVDRLVCLGDIVGYYANPNECIDLVRRHAVACVRGNHDSVAAGLRPPMEFSPVARRAIAWTSGHLTDDRRKYLESLPLLQRVDEAFVIVHAALHPKPNDAQRIRNTVEARPSLEMLANGHAGPRVRLCFFGHMHQPAAYVMRGGEVAEVNDEELCLDGESIYLINPGSVGQSRNADPRAAFLLYDSTSNTVRFHHIGYDSAAAKTKAIARGLIRPPHPVLRTLSWLKRHLPVPRPSPVENSSEQVDHASR